MIASLRSGEPGRPYCGVIHARGEIHTIRKTGRLDEFSAKVKCVFRRVWYPVAGSLRDDCCFCLSFAFVTAPPPYNFKASVNWTFNVASNP